MGTTDLVSVIVPSYNMAGFLADAATSVLRQTWKSLELIIVDDGSSDGTGAMADRLALGDARVSVIHKTNGGLSSARNAGIQAARGEFVCFLDADDMLLPDKLEKQLAFLRLFTRCDLVYSDHYVGDDKLTPMFLACKRPPRMPMHELLTYRNWFAPFSPLVRSSVLEKVGGFDESLQSSEDWDFWIRASRCTAFSYLPGPVGVYRTHPGQMHRNYPQRLVSWDKVISKHFARGSSDWRIARASKAWLDARFRWGSHEYLPTATRLISCVWHARSRRTVKNIVSLVSD
jgi:glycosyltransferase involved in cell wall biosynthesis